MRNKTPLGRAGRMRVVRELLKYAFPHRRALIATAGVLLLTAGLEAVPPYLMKRIIDGGVLTSSESRFYGLIGLLLAVYVLEAAFQALKSSVGIRVGNAMMSRIRQDMFDKLLKLSVRYYDQRKSAPFIGRIQYDTASMQGFLSEGIPNLLTQAVMTAAVIAMLFALNWRLAAALAAALPLAALLLWRLWPKMRSLRLRIWNAEYGLQQYVSEALQGIRIIKAFRQEDAERRRFAEWNATAVRRSAEMMRWSQWLHPAMNLAVSAGIAFVWLVGGTQVIRGTTSLGTVIAFTSYLSLFLGQLRWTYRSAGWANKSIASAERVLDLMRAPDEGDRDGVSFAVPLRRAKGEIAVRSVSFAYEQGRDALRDVSLQIRPGEKVGITGRSGAGKTTLLHLLCKFYDPAAGRVELDGIDLRLLSGEELRRQIGVVFQETFLFDGTIAQNIAYGRPEATSGEILEAARAARAHDFIARLPHAYDTRVGERGVRLSGGEKQRIAIARALLLDPAILLLDEATSAMDAETEKELRDALERLCRGRTTVIVAHRLSTLRGVDRIFVLDRGRLAESGTHAELAARGGIYARLLRANRSEPAIEEALP